MRKNLLLSGYIFLIILALFGCVTPDKAGRVFDRHPVDAAEYCDLRFPLVESTVVMPGTVQTDTVIKTITDVLSFPCPVADSVITYKIKYKYQDREVRTEVHDTLVKTIPDTRQAAIWKGKHDEQKKDAAKWKEKAGNRWTLNLWLIVALVACIAWITRKIWLA